MDQLAALFTEAVFWARNPAAMRALDAVVRLQARFRGRASRKDVGFVTSLLRDRNCTLEYGVVTALGGVVVVERIVPVRHDPEAFLECAKQCLRIDGILPAIIDRYVNEDTIHVDGNVSMRDACMTLHGGSVARVVPRGRPGIMALAQCRDQWTVQLRSGQRLQVHSQPAPTVDETIALLRRQLRDAGLHLAPSAATPRVVSDDGFYTEIHSCVALNSGTLALMGDYSFVERRRGMCEHPDKGAPAPAHPFYSRLHPYTLCRMRDDHVGDSWLMPHPKRCRH